MEPTPLAPPAPIAPVIQPVKSRKKIWVIGIACLVTVGIAGAGYYWFQGKDSSADSPTTTSKNSVENPVTVFWQKFSQQDYRIMLMHESGGRGETLYFEKGQLVRVDTNDFQNSMTLIFKNGKLFILSNNTKTFLELDALSSQAQFMLMQMQTNAVLGLLIQSETPPSTPWTRSEDTSGTNVGYQTTGRQLLLSASQGPTSADMKILVQPSSGLITTIAYKTEAMLMFKSISFEYEVVPDLAPLKRFPVDYQKTQPGVK